MTETEAAARLRRGEVFPREMADAAAARVKATEPRVITSLMRTLDVARSARA
ncbi:hypothetical protein [Roseomonas rosulenta]|uniref:hypothetical protein n=1 Tax=Roseomonas rosulenta TaxID=2748667 RepID=UPI0018DF0239|nr:hypothetical protein [Roseomonas rosulenta]